MRVNGAKVPVLPNNNANYMWILHFIYHLAPNGKAGFVMANGALSAEGVEREIRKAIVKADLVYGIVACPPKPFYIVSFTRIALVCKKREARTHEREGVVSKC